MTKEGVQVEAATADLPARLEQGTSDKGGEPEGYSIPAQREACRRKASSRQP